MTSRAVYHGVIAPTTDELAEVLDEMSEQIKTGEPPRLPERYERLIGEREQERGFAAESTLAGVLSLSNIHTPEFYSPEREPQPHERSPSRRSPRVTNTILNSEIRASGAQTIEEWREKVGFCAKRAVARSAGASQSSTSVALVDQPKTMFFTDSQMLPAYIEAFRGIEELFEGFQYCIDNQELCSILCEKLQEGRP